MALPGLAAAAVSQPTVAEHTHYCSHVQTGIVANEAGAYGHAPDGLVIAVHDNCPAKRVSGGEHSPCNALHGCARSWISFPKTLVLGRVVGASFPLTATRLPSVVASLRPLTKESALVVFMPCAAPATTSLPPLRLAS